MALRRRDRGLSGVGQGGATRRWESPSPSTVFFLFNRSAEKHQNPHQFSEVCMSWGELFLGGCWVNIFFASFDFCLKHYLFLQRMPKRRWLKASSELRCQAKLQVIDRLQRQIRNGRFNGAIWCLCLSHELFGFVGLIDSSSIIPIEHVMTFLKKTVVKSCCFFCSRHPLAHFDPILFQVRQQSSSP